MLAANAALRKGTAQARYAAACIALVLLLALPLVTFCALLSTADQMAVRAPSAIESVEVPQQTASSAYSLERTASLVLDVTTSTPQSPTTRPTLVTSPRTSFPSV